MAKSRNILNLPIRQIVLDKELQMRANGLDREHVADLREAIHSLQDIPRIKVILCNGKYFLVEGYHRVEAYRLEGKATVPAEVKPGTWDEAVEAATAANIGHTALKRSNADKRRAVEKLDALHPRWSTRKIAAHVGVSHTLVVNVRGERAAETEDESSTDESVDSQPGADEQNDDCLANGEDPVESDSTPEPVMIADNQDGDRTYTAYDKAAFYAKYAALEQEVIILAKCYGQLDTEGKLKSGNSDAAALQDKLAAWKEDFVRFETRLKKDREKQPELF